MSTNINERARELKPCPFCGGEATISWKGNVHSTRSVVVKCSGCRYERKDSALRYGDDWLLDVAVTAWNRRALSHAAAVEGEPVAWRFYNEDHPALLPHWTGWSADRGFRDLCEKLGMGAEFAYPQPAPAAVPGVDSDIKALLKVIYEGDGDDPHGELDRIKEHAEYLYSLYFGEEK